MNVYEFMCLELIKLAQEAHNEVSPEEAVAAHKQLQRLTKSAPTKGQLLRGAVSGAAILPMFAVGANLIKGKAPKTLGQFGREAAADALRGAAIGSVLPLTRQHMNVEAEKEKIRRYLGTSELTPTRSKVRRVLGVG